MIRYLLDTNHVSGLWKNEEPVTRRVSSEPTAHFALCLPAVARSQGLVLLTADAHFSYVGGLTTENWLTP